MKGVYIQSTSFFVSLARTRHQLLKNLLMKSLKLKAMHVPFWTLEKKYKHIFKKKQH